MKNLEVKQPSGELPFSRYARSWCRCISCCVSLPPASGLQENDALMGQLSPHVRPALGRKRTVWFTQGKCGYSDQRRKIMKQQPLSIHGQFGFMKIPFSVGALDKA